MDTKEVVTETIILQGSPITIKEDHLQIDSKIIAELEDVPVLKVLPQKEYDEKEKEGILDNDTYYYTYDSNIRLVTNSDLAKESEKLQQ